MVRRLWGLDEAASRRLWQAFSCRADLPPAERWRTPLPGELRGWCWASWWWALLTESYDHPLRTLLGLVVTVLELGGWLWRGWLGS